MKIILTLFLFLGLFVQKTYAQTYTVAALRTLAAPQESVIYQTTDYGGGLWNYSAATGATDNTGTILVSTITGGRFKRIFSGELNILWFGAKGDGVTNDVPAWTLAKAALPPEGGTIYFPKGRYMSDANGWQVYRNNLYMRGDGINTTYLLTPEPSNASGISLAPYRDAGWSLNPATLYTYVDSAAVGQGWIKLKPGQDKTPFKKNTVFFFNAGANYYDQFYGEFQVIDTVVGDKLYLKYNFSKDYTAARSSWNGTLTADFTPPAVNATAVAQITNPPAAGANVAVSLGNDLYQVTAQSGTSVTLKNLGKGNGTAVIPTGTKVYKARAVYLTPSTAYNTIVEDMTIEGHRKAVVVANSVKSYFNRVRFVYHDGAAAGGIWLDGDGGRDFIMYNSEAYSDVIKGSQMARSFGDIKYKTCKFFQSTLEFSEFNYNFDVEDCDIHVHKVNDTIPVNYAINVGQSTSNGRIYNNRIFVSDANNAIIASDILGYKASSRASMLISKNIIYANRCASAISVYGSGTVSVEDNSIIGNVNSIFGGSDAILYGASSQVDVNDRFVFGSSLIIKRNTFVGYANTFSNRTDPVNLDIEDNIVSLFGPGYVSDVSGLTLGNIIKGSVASVTPTLTVPAERMVIKNNLFKGWNYTPFSINLQRPVNSRVDVSNNRFIDQVGTYRADKDFVVNLHDANAVVYAGVNYLPLVKSPDIDWNMYTEFVKRTSGTLLPLDVTVGKQLLKDIYFNNMRDKIEMINPMLGNAAASKVPLLGWERSVYKAFAGMMLTDSDFTKTTGWKGNGTSKYGVIGQVKDFDYTNFGLFVNLTAAGTVTNGGYIGTYSGNGASSYLIRKNGTTLTGIGLSTIATSYTEAPGFIFSGQTIGSQLNFVDVTTKPKTSNTSLPVQLSSSPEANLAILAQGSSVLSAINNFSDATLGGYGVTKFLNLTETQTLDQITYNAMVSLGRATQTNPAYVLSTVDLREGKTPITNPTSTAISKAILNSTYPMAVKGQRIYCPNVSTGPLVYEKADNTGEWFFYAYTPVL
ncbi:hypothetical protein LPB86_19120 [Pedobacter sp. MC2016-14]|uniref:glycosyl hydrolase family 28-related protein n=1 Tax=Pedobacter sp. MC2016-14 TaxID=2897327 RepID=UPI001E5886A4|nr:glycosyl hydrolase family 28-related protein [Pedobacter sp. MC2016-14]MCD0490357.1 hypothetical protein [Pedobacter sp. MC2016-14]